MHGAAGHFGRVNDAGFEHVFIRLGHHVVADRTTLEAPAAEITLEEVVPSPAPPAQQPVPLSEAAEWLQEEASEGADALFRAEEEFFDLASELEDEGFVTANIDYPSRDYTVEELAATAVPVARATGVDPLEALRVD